MFPSSIAHRDAGYSLVLFTCFSTSLPADRAAHSADNCCCRIAVAASDLIAKEAADYCTADYANRPAGAFFIDDVNTVDNAAARADRVLVRELALASPQWRPVGAVAGPQRLSVHSWQIVVAAALAERPPWRFWSDLEPGCD